jgi:hypothetical protein
MFQGYFAPKMTSGVASAQPFGPVSFDDARKSGAKYMLVMFAGFTWSACQGAAKDLAAKVRNTSLNVVGKGGLIFGILTEGAALDSSQPATKTELDAWVSAAGENAPNTWVIESTPVVESYFNTGRDSYFVIDLSTMKIVSTYFSAEAAAFNDLMTHLQ